MASSAAAAATTTNSEAADGPVLTLINKRLRALRKKLNRILQMEESVAQGKPINKEQEEVLRSKPSVVASIDELEKLRPQLCSALQEELSLASRRCDDSGDEGAAEEKQTLGSQGAGEGGRDAAVEDLLNLLYFGSMFTVSSPNDYTSTMVMRRHERGCCLTYDYVTDDATDLLGERDLDLISMLSGLLISRSVGSSSSHKNALLGCIEHAKLWLANSDQPIEPNSSVTYAALKERLNKIMASDYFTATPELKAPVEVEAAAAAGNYPPFQVPVTVPTQVEDQSPQYEQKDDEVTDFQRHEVNNESVPIDEEHKDELTVENPEEFVSEPQEIIDPLAEEANQREREQKDHQYMPRRNYHNQRGGTRGGRRGYPNGRGGRSGSRGGGGYQNGRSYYHEQPGNYYPRNYYNNRGRGGRGGMHPFNNHGPAAHGGHAPADVGVAS